MGHVDHGKTSLLDYIRQSERGRRRGGRHHPAHRRVHGHGRPAADDHVPGHAGPRGLHGHARPRRPGHGHRGPGGRGRRQRHAADARGDQPRAGGRTCRSSSPSTRSTRPTPTPDRIRQQLSEKNILVEEWGGKYQSVEISARTGKNVDLLLEKIALEADVLDLKANPERTRRATIIEAQVDKGKGTIATVLVQKGTLRIGRSVRRRHLQRPRPGDVRRTRADDVESAGPSTPVQITGARRHPPGGRLASGVDTERDAREISLRRPATETGTGFPPDPERSRWTTSRKRSRTARSRSSTSIVKGDVDGSVEALSDSLMKIDAQRGEGERYPPRRSATISESDVLLAAASGAVIIGFHVRPNLNARVLAEQENVDIRTVQYHLRRHRGHPQGARRTPRAREERGSDGHGGGAGHVQDPEDRDGRRAVTCRTGRSPAATRCG